MRKSKAENVGVIDPAVAAAMSAHLALLGTPQGAAERAALKRRDDLLAGLTAQQRQIMALVARGLERIAT